MFAWPLNSLSNNLKIHKSKTYDIMTDNAVFAIQALAVSGKMWPTASNRISHSHRPPIHTHNSDHGDQGASQYRGNAFILSSQVPPSPIGWLIVQEWNQCSVPRETSHSFPTLSGRDTFVFSNHYPAFWAWVTHSYCKAVEHRGDRQRPLPPCKLKTLYLKINHWESQK